MFCIETSFKTISQSLHSWLGSTLHLRFHPSSHCPGKQDHKQLLNCQESSSRPLAGNHTGTAWAGVCDWRTHVEYKGHSHSTPTSLVPYYPAQHPLQSEVSALTIRDDRGANPGTFNTPTASEIKFQFGCRVLLQFYPACSLVKRETCVKVQAARIRCASCHFLLAAFGIF